MINPRRPLWRFGLLSLALGLGPCLLIGCTLIGLGAQALPPATVQAQYKGLAGQRVGVMVWADRGTRIEWEWIQLDVANSIQSKLEATAKDKKAKVKELAGATFPYPPRSMIRYQQDHPDIEGESITTIAPRLDVTRLIYIEIEEFSTRPDGRVELYRGEARLTLRVVEVAPDGSAKVAYEENEVTATFPRKAPKEGLPTVGDRRIYVGTIDALGAEIAKRFVPHPEEE